MNLNTRLMKLVVVATLLANGNAFAEASSTGERSAEYAIRITDGRTIATLPSQTWTIRRAPEGAGIEVDLGNDNIQVHDSEIAIYAADDDSHVIETFRPHPQIAQAQGMKKWAGFVKRVKPGDDDHDVVLETWPVFYQLIENGEVTIFIATHFLSKGKRVIWRRVYFKDDFFLPAAVIQEVYETPDSDTPDYVMTFRKLE